jgi:NitT/TauT family transport system substrate-binding protein
MTRRSFMQALGMGALGLLGPACGQAAQTAQPTSAAVATQATAPALAAATSPSAAPAVSGSAATVKITDIQITSAAGSYIAAERGYFRDEGVDAQFLASSASEQVTAVLAGSADVAGTVINAQLYNALARGLPLKMVADHGANLRGASAGGFVIRKDLVDSGQYGSAADVKGWKIGAGAPGSTADIALDRFLHSGGLDIKDIEQTTLGFPEILAAFSNKAIQGAYFQEPFTTIGVEQGLCVRGPIGYDMYPDQQIAVVLFGQKLFSDRELSSHYVRAYTRGVRDYVKGLLQKDRAMFDLVVPILIAHTTVKDRSLFERAIPSGLKADPIPNVQSMKDDQDWFVQHGFVQQPIQVDQFVDLSFVQEAIKQLGPAG